MITGSGHYINRDLLSTYPVEQCIDLHLHPEFTYELVLGVPYAKWLNDRRQLGVVYTCKDMAPYYYFADRVVEKYDQRTINNSISGIQDLPNNWIHHNAMVVFGKDYGDMTPEEKLRADGVLDYSQWTPPDYATVYGGEMRGLKLKKNKPLIIINNQFNIEKGQQPTRYFDIECIYLMLEMLSKDYQIVYNRPNNTKFPVDENEQNTLHQNLRLEANVEGLGIISDYELIAKYPGNVHTFDKLHAMTDYSYNEFQLRLFAQAHGFIGLVGGGGTLSCFYKKPTILYETVSRALSPGYWSPDSYHQVLSGQNAHPVLDRRDKYPDGMGHDYHRLYELINELFL